MTSNWDWRTQTNIREETVFETNSKYGRQNKQFNFCKIFNSSIPYPLIERRFTVLAIPEYVDFFKKSTTVLISIFPPQNLIILLSIYCTPLLQYRVLYRLT